MSGEEIKKRRMIECPEISRTDMNLPAAELKTEEYEIELITPMVGGGVEAGEVDPEMPVRASEIKGHLRFWWRVWKGGAFSKTEEMFKEESKIWGSTENPSSVILNVERLSELGVSKISDILKVEKVSEATAFQQQKTQKNYLGYVLFPFKKGASYISNLKFKLKIQYPKEYEADVKSALKLWLNFGGIGARTRRGCGALFCENMALSKAEIFKKEDLVALFVRSGTPDPQDWPRIDRILVKEAKTNNELSCWNDLINIYYNFRQDRAGGQKSQGRSNWPEPESIREITNKRCHYRPRQPHIPVRYFPRAELGLPINFHFKDKDNGDPSDVNVVPEGFERMASPILIRPLKLKEGNILEAVVILAAKKLQEISVGGNKLGHQQIINPVLSGYPHSPLQNLSSSGSALEGFIELLKKKEGFTEVWP